MKIWFLILFLIPVVVSAQAPPGNNICSQANEIVITDNGFGLGTFTSAKTNLTHAAKEQGESFHPLIFYAGLDKKSVWYKFEIFTSRSVTINLRQKDTLIGQDEVGFVVYKANACPPNLGEVDDALPAITKFGSSKNTCFKPGTYYIQVCARHTANHEIWIELELDHPYPAAYNTIAQAHDFKVISGSKSVTLDIGCQSIENEKDVFSHPDYNSDYLRKTTWFTFTSDDYIEFLRIELALSKGNFKSDTTYLGMQLMEVKSTTSIPVATVIDSLFFTALPNGNSPKFSYSKYCYLKPNTQYYLKLFSHKDQNYGLRVTLHEQGTDSTKGANPKALPISHKLGVLQKGAIKKVIDHFSCNAAMANYLCGNTVEQVVIDSSENSNRQYDLNLWVTFEVKEDGILTLPHNIFCGNSNVNHHNVLFYRLFKEDVTANCNLTLAQTGDFLIPYPLNSYYLQPERICLSPGKYSLQILGASFRQSGSGCLHSDLGKRIELELVFSDIVQQVPMRFNVDAEQLGNTDQWPTNGITSKIEFYGGNDTSVTILGQEYGNRVSFKEFYVGSSARIEIRNFGRVRNQIFSGRVSTGGIDSLSMLPWHIRPSQIYEDALGRSDRCMPMPSGWYTIVSYVNIGCHSTAQVSNHLRLKALKEECANRFNIPQNASLVNNGLPLTYNTSSPTANMYIAEQTCFPCIADLSFTPSHPIFCSSNPNPYSNIAYYVFKIDKESFLSISTYANFVVYKGNVKTKPSILNDSLNIISFCRESGRYCLIQPGEYSLIIMDSVYQLHSPVFYVDMVRTTFNDHAIKAIDLGVLPDNNSWKSANTRFYCSTGSRPDDPPGKKTSTPIPYPMPKDYVLPLNSEKNAWFTFAVANSGRITLEGSSSSVFGNPNVYYYVYRSNKPGHLPFNTLWQSGMLDSTIDQGLEFVLYNSGSSPKSFNKGSCDTSRYYVVAYSSDFVSNIDFKLSFSYEQMAANASSGNYCSNPALFAVNNTGTARVSTAINCNTLGNNFGEDGSNMGCLVTNNNTEPLKSVWFKFIFTTTSPADLVFNINNKSSAPGEKIRYRVLYGDCNAMTAGPCAGNIYSSFKLDCMGSGEYYLQVIVPQDALGEIEASVTATPTTYAICKPVDLFKPVANFYATGGCNGDSVKFFNLSTAGSNIEYAWDFGNGSGSTVKEPVVGFTSIKPVDTFLVKLVVKYIVTGASDSLIIPVLYFRDPVILSTTADTTILCSKSIKLNAKVNYSGAIFLWSPENAFDNPYKASSTIFPKYSADYSVTAKIENCTVKDTVTVNVTRRIKLLGDNIFCVGQTALLRTDEGYNSYFWNSYFATSHQKLVTAPGKYWVTAYASDCVLYSDTIDVQFKNAAPPELNIQPQNVNCQGEELSFNTTATQYSIRWSTGDTTAKIKIQKEGLYWVKIFDGNCFATDSIYINSVERIEISDTILCENETVVLDAGNPGATYLWSTGDVSQKLLVSQPGTYGVTVTTANCLLHKEVEVKYNSIPAVNFSDTIHNCEGKETTLHAIPGFRNFWSTGDTIGTITINTSGKISLETVKGRCSRTDSAYVMFHKNLLPDMGLDTNICDELNILLDAGEGAQYLWQPVNSLSRYFFATEHGSYNVHVTDEFNCEKISMFNITEDCSPIIYVPNAFHPSGTINPIFKAEGKYIEEYELTIFNRWGERLFYTNDIHTGWDGTFRGYPLPEGVFVYIISYRGKNKSGVLNGTITLLR